MKKLYVSLKVEKELEDSFGRELKVEGGDIAGVMFVFKSLKSMRLMYGKNVKYAIAKET